MAEPEFTKPAFGEREITVPRVPGPPIQFGPFKKLRTVGQISASYEYDPADHLSAVNLINTDQTITIHHEEDWFLMSGVGMLRKVVAPPFSFKGYLSKFRLDPMEGDGVLLTATATLTIIPTEVANAPPGPAEVP